jgi:hypothetical protein
MESSPLTDSGRSDSFFWKVFFYKGCSIKKTLSRKGVPGRGSALPILDIFSPSALRMGSAARS